MKGYKTIIINIAAVLGVLGAHYGFDLPAEAWEAGVLAIFNILLRFLTTTAVGEKE